MTKCHHSDSERAHLRGIETTKKPCMDHIARFSDNLGFGNRTIISLVRNVGFELPKLLPVSRPYSSLLGEDQENLAWVAFGCEYLVPLSKRKLHFDSVQGIAVGVVVSKACCILSLLTMHDWCRCLIVVLARSWSY